MYDTLQQIGEAGLHGLGVIGNATDTLGASVRDVLAGQAPQFHSPLSDDRLSGRDVLRKWGVAGKEDTWTNFLGGMALEAATDPLSYTPPALLKHFAKVKAIRDSFRTRVLARNARNAGHNVEREMAASLAGDLARNNDAYAAHNRAFHRMLDASDDTNPRVNLDQPPASLAGYLKAWPHKDQLAYAYGTLDDAAEAVRKNVYNLHSMERSQHPLARLLDNNGVTRAYQYTGEGPYGFATRGRNIVFVNNKATLPDTLVHEATHSFQYDPFAATEYERFMDNLSHKGVNDAADTLLKRPAYAHTGFPQSGPIVEPRHTGEAAATWVGRSNRINGSRTPEGRILGPIGAYIANDTAEHKKQAVNALLQPVSPDVAYLPSGQFIAPGERIPKGESLFDTVNADEAVAALKDYLSGAARRRRSLVPVGGVEARQVPKTFVDDWLEPTDADLFLAASRPKKLHAVPPISRDHKNALLAAMIAHQATARSRGSQR